MHCTACGKDANHYTSLDRVSWYCDTCWPNNFRAKSPLELGRSRDKAAPQSNQEK